MGYENDFQMKKIFSAEDGRALCIACDHGLMMDPGKSWLQISKTVYGAVQSEVDGLLLSSGQVRRFRAKFDKERWPATIIRTDWTNLLRLSDSQDECSLLPVNRMEYRRLMSAKEVLIRYGGAATIGFLFIDPDRKIETLTIKSSRELISESHEVSLPCIVEVLPLMVGHPDADPIELLWRGVWAALELGADAIKMPLTADTPKFCAAIHEAGKRIFVLGGSSLSDEDAFLDLMQQAICAKVDGLLVGRNVCQNDNPSRLIGKLRSIVHPEKKSAT